MSDYEHDIGYYVERWIEAEEEVKELRKEAARLRKQAACGHSPWPCCDCDYQGKMFNPRATK